MIPGMQFSKSAAPTRHARRFRSQDLVCLVRPRAVCTAALAVWPSLLVFSLSSTSNMVAEHVHGRRWVCVGVSVSAPFVVCARFLCGCGRAPCWVSENHGSWVAYLLVRTRELTAEAVCRNFCGFSSLSRQQR